VQEFHSIYRHGMARVAACASSCTLADPEANADNLIAVARACHEQGVAVAVFPELGLCGYAIDDLLLQDALHASIGLAVQRVVQASADLLPLLLVGAPLAWGTRLYNCALAIHRGRVLGVVPKQYLPNYREFYEKRHFASGQGSEGGEIELCGQRVPFGPDLLFCAEDVAHLCVHAEICEDLWVPMPPSGRAALAGANLLCNLSASNITIGKSDTRELLCRAQSLRCVAAYLYAAAGGGESTTDLAWDGQAQVFENGECLARTERFAPQNTQAIADVDLDLLRQERQRVGSFDDNARCLAAQAAPFRRVAFRLDPPRGDLGLRRTVARFPFVPSDPARLDQDCYEAYHIQVAGLVQRLRATGTQRLVIGVSGGLDSTHALIVAARAFDQIGLPRKQLLAYTLPGFATSSGTKSNALALMQALGCSARELDIRPAARQMLADLEHPFATGEPVYDITFENVQAGLRTDYLFRLANRRKGFVLGTGDLSELALGWCTYGVGDQMSHYNVNSGVPKTLIQHLVRWVIASGQFEGPVNATLQSILDTEISPELVPAQAGDKPQSTQARIGPYALQDFNLFYTLRYGFAPSKIAFLAHAAWSDPARGTWPAQIAADDRRSYTLGEIRAWLEVFLQRFFGYAQFKRSAMPNGPKVTAGGSLSPRGDWRAPSDAGARAWLDELRRNVPEA
jgi:NAD+ synthase (glutamine-hydrolysing)